MEAGKKNIPTLVENFASRQNSIPNPKSEKTIIYETVALTQMSPNSPDNAFLSKYILTISILIADSRNVPPQFAASLHFPKRIGSCKPTATVGDVP